ncbi:MAG: hypothetical protein U5K51_14590 [Flavobacteriaceae bacterium]|nr:hypothetical protein [Flavobacteriaceae bacterium]
MNLLFEHTDNILIKLSPILDISAALNELKFVKEIHTVAVDNEVKELLFILEKGYGHAPKLIAVNIHKGKTEKLEAAAMSPAKAHYGLPKTYLYEPNAAILKTGLFNEVSLVYKIDKLHTNSHLYTSEELVGFPGRTFKIIAYFCSRQEKTACPDPFKESKYHNQKFPVFSC